MSRATIVRAVFAMPVAVILLLGTLVAVWLHTGNIPLAGGSRWFTVVKVGEAHFTDEPTEPFFFLAVGNDGRTGDVDVRGDAIHLIGVNPALRSATILDIPRDTTATIPGNGRQKINAAQAIGGLPLLTETVADLVGVSIPYAITTDFDGFQALVDGVGGVDVFVETEMSDQYSGAFFTPGLHHMNGDEALRFSRDRHDLPNGDIGRSVNQGNFIIAALAQLRANNLGAAGTLRSLATLGAHTHMEGVGLTDLYRLGRLALSIDPVNIRNVAIPVGTGSGANLALGAGAAGLFADFADDAVLQSH
ncbi:MAG TPA: LCP family protein [Acidimicrobiia bacterium]|nr:LCP family protein [Acidimicrobiia bacterium]